jgi:hypothetical protein
MTLFFFLFFSTVFYSIEPALSYCIFLTARLNMLHYYRHSSLGFELQESLVYKHSLLPPPTPRLLLFLREIPFKRYFFHMFHTEIKVALIMKEK